jgi:serine/threonine protein kinase
MSETIFKTFKEQPLELLHKIASGGEGTIWQTNIPQFLAKIYHTTSDTIQPKILAMLADPPQDPMRAQGHTSIAWPQDGIVDADNNFRGFLLPRISGTLTLNHIYNPKLRKKHAPGFNWFYLHTTAANIASILDSLHQRDYVIGDIKTDNFLVTENALVSVLDTDSFQINVKNQAFRCTMGSEGFTPPELIGQDFHTIDRTEIHDRFGLAVLIHLLLLGYHPFSGDWRDATPLGRDQAIQQGLWPYDGTDRIKPSPFAIPYEILTPEIRAAFLAAFQEGHTSPHKRPSAKEWQNLLQRALQQLTVCTQNPNHYHVQNQSCYWCDRATTTGLEIFPSLTVGEQDYIVQHFTRALQSQDIKAITILWNKHPFLHQDQRLKVHDNLIQRSCAYILALEQFTELCQGEATTDQILDWWTHDERLNYFPPDPTLEIRGQPLNTFLQVLQEKRKALEALRAAVHAANNLDMVDEDHEMTIVQRLHQTPWSADVRQREPVLFQRADLAEKRITTLQHFRQYFLQNDAGQAAHLLLSYENYLQDFKLSQAQKNFLTTAKHHFGLFQEFSDLIQQGPAQDINLVKLWEEQPLMHTSTFAQQPVDSLSLADHIQQAQGRLELAEQLKNLLQAKDYIGIANLWDAAAPHAKEIFAPYATPMQQGLHKKSIWLHLRRAALEQELKHHILDWDETNFYPLAKAEKLEAALQDAFVDAYDDTHFPQNPIQKVIHHNNFLEILWPWPQAKWPVPLCLWAVRHDRFPQSPQDIEETFHGGWCWNSGGMKEHKAWVPFSHQKVYVCIWPAHFVCKKPVILGKPLSLQDQSSTRVFYTYVTKKSLFRKQEMILSIKFFAETGCTMPPLSIYGHEEYPPTPDDSQKITLGTLQALNLVKQKHFETKLKISASINDKIFVRLYPMEGYQPSILLMPPMDLEEDVKYKK